MMCPFWTQKSRLRGPDGGGGIEKPNSFELTKPTAKCILKAENHIYDLEAPRIFEALRSYAGYLCRKYQALLFF